MGLIAGGTAQQYNQRKKRKGAFWQDRYHATAIETGEHLLRCLVYIDLNMVRAGVVDHPSKWPHGGSNEIQAPRRKNIIIAYERLRELAGFEDYQSLVSAHRKWVQAALEKIDAKRESRWTESIAAGGRPFIERNVLKTPWEPWQKAAAFNPVKVHLNCGKRNPSIMRFLIMKIAI